MAKRVTMTLVGAGGYGGVYLEALDKDKGAHGIELVACADPFAAKAKEFARLKNVPVFDDVAQALKQHPSDLVVIASPIQFHCEQTCRAFELGANVLCEKPIAATVQEVERMIKARDAAKKLGGIGFQYAWEPGIIALKDDIIGGAFGKPKRFSSTFLMARDEVYYGRNAWAGKQKDGKGNWVLDSPVNNSFAHSLHLMLHLLGKSAEVGAELAWVEAELYRVNPIENYDTAAVRAQTAAGVPVFFFASHAVGRDEHVGPAFSLEFENATVAYSGDGGEGSGLLATFTDGTKRLYDDPPDGEMDKLWTFAEAVRGNAKVTCSFESAGAHTRCMNGAQMSMPIADIPASEVVVAGEAGKRLRTVKDLAEIMARCAKEWKLPHEVGVSWAKKPGRVQLGGLKAFA